MKRPYGDLRRIQHMIDNADVLITAWSGAVEFYPKLRFNKADKAFVIPRKQ
ncbi:hypothetical protein ACFOQM_17575 [Paenibacillus sp. GCM10012307]|uniref:hypothetical protein n=1 Tax=Paenibacillus sp. GCM10012307 TaxID=3317343 RepID=UPI003614832B